jgi:predicted Zn-dependent protease
MCRHCNPSRGTTDPDPLDDRLAAAAVERIGPAEICRRLLLKGGLALLALPGAQLLQGCAAVPITGRSQLRLVSETEEAQIGVQAFQQLRDEEAKKGRLLSEREDPAAHAAVRRVVERVIAASGLAAAYRWEYMLVNAPKTANAAAIAGGRIIVYTGILPITQNDAGLAAVIGHEVGHVMAHHTGERISQNMAVQRGATLAGAAFSSQLLAAVVPAAAQVGVLLPYSRAQESEADHIGLLLMARAGYDPRESIHLWERMSRGAEGRPPEFLSTHPSPETRIAQLQAWLAEAWPYYQNPGLPLPNLR